MIRHPLGLRIDPARPVRDQIYEAARMGARGVVLDAIGDLAPQRLGETGRRELRHLLRTVELSLVALSLPTRRPFDTTDQLDERIRRADGAFALAYELGTNLVLARVGAVPPEEDGERLGTFTSAMASLGQRADHRGVRLAVETGTEPGQKLKAFLDSLDIVGLAASIDPSAPAPRGDRPRGCRSRPGRLGRSRLRRRRLRIVGRRPGPSPRLRVRSRRSRLGELPRVARGDRLLRLPHDLARPRGRCPAASGTPSSIG